MSVLKDLGRAPAKTLYVGDSTYDILAAQAAGMPVAAALWGAGVEAELRALAPDAMLQAPHELLHWLLKTAEPAE